MATINNLWWTKRDGKRVKTKAHGEGKQWQVRWYVGKRQYSQSFDTEAQANTFRDNLIVQRSQGIHVNPHAGKVTVDSLAARWIEIKTDVTPATRERYRQIVTDHITADWRGVQVADIVPSDIQAWLSRQTKQKCAKRDSLLSTATVRKNFRVLSMIIDMAVADGRIHRNPCKHESVKLPRLVQAKRRYLTHRQVDELARLAAQPRPNTRATQDELASRDQYRLIVLVLAYCGLRWGELAALRVGSLDLHRKHPRMRVEESAVEVEGVFQWGVPKGHERRSVPLPDFIADELAAHVNGKGRDDLLFSGARSGGPMRNRVFRDAGFDRAATAMGLDGLSPHELRHTAASLAVSAGANVKAVQRMLGHHSAAMTLDVYADLFDDDLDSVGVVMASARMTALAAPDEDCARTEAEVITLDSARQAAAGQ